jgi:tetrapyrrole methylase family protein/MazG family protein
VDDAPAADAPATDLPATPEISGALDGDVPSHDRGERLLDVLTVMARLRGPGGCPWDAEQTHQTLARHLLEEAHETLEAIESGRPDRLKDELGDLLLQVVFHAEIARQEGAFDIDDVAEALVRKLIRRHPHVFGDTNVGSAAEVLVNWERIKADERTATSGAGDEREPRRIDEDIPATLPALARASKVQRRAAGFGFDWRSASAALAKVREELAELEVEAASLPDGGSSRTQAPPERVEEELGDVLFAVASLGRRLNVDPETALRRATARFAERFERMHRRAHAEGVDLDGLREDELLERFRAAGSG